jgi:hypothetical protein
MYPGLGVKGGNGDGTVLIECLVELRSQHTNVLGYLWIDRVLLLGKGWYSRPNASPTRASAKRIFIISSGGLGTILRLTTCCGIYFVRCWLRRPGA